MPTFGHLPDGAAAVDTGSWSAEVFQERERIYFIAWGLKGEQVRPFALKERITMTAQMEFIEMVGLQPRNRDGACISGHGNASAGRESHRPVFNVPLAGTAHLLPRKRGGKGTQVVKCEMGGGEAFRRIVYEEVVKVQRTVPFIGDSESDVSSGAGIVV